MLRNADLQTTLYARKLQHKQDVVCAVDMYIHTYSLVSGPQTLSPSPHYIWKNEEEEGDFPAGD